MQNKKEEEFRLKMITQWQQIGLGGNYSKVIFVEWLA